MTHDSLTLSQVRTWLTMLPVEFAARQAELDALDAAVGDGDHGTTMARGFGGVAAAAQSQADIGAMLQSAGRTLLKMGGAAGPLFSTFFLEAGRVAAGTTALAPGEIAEMLARASAGVQARGRAQVGQKTMVDALQPAAEAARAAAAAGGSAESVIAAAAEAARTSAAETRKLVAQQGRARFLGERSADHQDPGAASVSLLLETLWKAVRRAEAAHS